MKQPTILVVEDEALIALDIKRILDEEGYQTIIDCFSVESAKKILAQQLPDLVLIDINLKGAETGIDLAKYLLQLDAVPFVFLTSYSDKITLEETRSTRPYGYLVKPFKSADLLSLIYIVLSNFEHRKVDVVRSTEPITTEAPYRIKLAIEYIQTHIEEKIEMSDLAKITKWEPEHFSRVFKSYTGISPHQYVLKQKVAIAKTWLAHTDDSIQEMAFRLGFNSYSNFFNAFKKITEETPEQYRIRCRNQREGKL